MEKKYSGTVAVQMINTRWLKSTYINTHGSSFIPG
jgi:hypothetical protein